MRTTRLLAALAITLLTGIASAQELSLRVADSLPPENRQSVLGIKPWMERVTAATNGSVTFQYFPNQQIGKAQDMMAMALSGAVDISYVIPATVSDKLPLQGVAELPGIYADPCAGKDAYWAQINEGGALYDAEIKPQGLKPLFPVVQLPYTIWARTKDVQTLDDLRGLRIRATGSAQTLFMEQLGAVPVNVQGPDVHEALSRGTLDGLVFPPTGIILFDVGDYLDYGLYKESFGGSAAFYAMSQQKWDSLPADVQAAMTQVGEEIATELCEGLTSWGVEVNGELGGMGVSLTDLSADVQTSLVEQQTTAQRTWAESFDARGLPGTAVLEAFVAAQAQ